MAIDASDVGPAVYCYMKITMMLIILFITILKSLTNISYYSTIEKILSLILAALQHFEVYLASSVAPIVIFTDHSPLTFIHKMKNKNQRLLRWSLMLQEHSLDIRYIKRKYNIIPDVLSRA